MCVSDLTLVSAATSFHLQASVRICVYFKLDQSVRVLLCTYLFMSHDDLSVQLYLCALGFLCTCVCFCVCIVFVFVRAPVRLLSMHASGMNNLFPSLRLNLPITSLHHCSSLPIHEFLCLQGCDWLLMNN